MAITLNQIKQELVNLIRNSDVISISDRGATTRQDTGTFSSAATHTLATSPTLVKNIRGLTVGGTEKNFGEDYTLNYVTGVLTFTTAETGAYVLDYDTSSTDRIFPDYPQANLKLNQFPRIAVDIISSNSNDFGIGAAITESSYSVSIICYDKSQEALETMLSSVKLTLMTNKKLLFYSAFITPTDIGPMLVSEFGDKKVFQRNQDAQVKFSVDTV